MQLKDIPNINKGGCGIVALALYKQFKSKPNIIKWFSSLTNESSFHIALLKGDEVIDIDGIRKIHSVSGYISYEIISLSELIHLIKNGIWNPSFDRNYIPLIEQITNTDLSEIYMNYLPNQYINYKQMSYPKREDITDLKSEYANQICDLFVGQYKNHALKLTDELRSLYKGFINYVKDIQTNINRKEIPLLLLFELLEYGHDDFGRTSVDIAIETEDCIEACKQFYF